MEARASKSRGDKMESENVPAKVEEPKTKQKKKKGKVKKVFEMHEKGASNKEISQKMNIARAISF